MTYRVFLGYRVLAAALALGVNVATGVEPAGGEHDFDFEFGTWKTHIARLVHPLSGSTTWVEYDGTSVVRQWSINFSNSSVGTLGQPTIGGFKDGRGEFYDQESFNGRAVLVRFVISEIKPDSCHFEQSFSTDGGRTWEVNWIATDTRVPTAP